MVNKRACTNMKSLILYILKCIFFISNRFESTWDGRYEIIKVTIECGRLLVSATSPLFKYSKEFHLLSDSYQLPLVYPLYLKRRNLFLKCIRSASYRPGYYPISP